MGLPARTRGDWRRGLLICDPSSDTAGRRTAEHPCCLAIALHHPTGMFAAFSIPISWTELLKRTAKETSADNVLGLAAQLAYYFLLALVPAMVFIVALTSFFPAELIDRMIASLGRVAPQDVFGIIKEQIDTLRGGSHGGVLTFGLLVALWSSSAALVSVTDALNKAYDIEEGRP